MKKYTELNLGYNDASNYQKKHNKTMFNEIFVKDDTLEKLINQDIYFLIGDKGTGKTAYATYLKNNNYKGSKTTVINIGETDYKTFFQLKKEKDLTLTDYTRIWKIIIMTYIAKTIDKDEINNSFPQRIKLFNDLHKSIDEYYSQGFIPETKTVLRYISDSSSQFSLSSTLPHTSFSANGQKSTETEKEYQTYQNNLLILEKHFFDALSPIKLNKNVFLIFDNADISHDGIELNEYLSILKSLSEAIIELNNNLLNNLRDSVGFMKVMLLIRPEIFSQLNIHNQANILTDNAIYLSWQTTYANYKNSKLFELANKILRFGNINDSDNATTNYWDLYFPWSSSSYSPFDEEKSLDNSFIDFLRNSLSRPRDLITILKIIQGIEQSCVTKDYYTHKSSMESPEFRKKLSDYYINEARDWCLYQYTAKQFDTIIYFFDFVKGKTQFSYQDFCSYYDDYTKAAIELDNDSISEILFDKDKFLQLLFDMNFICYVDYDFDGNAYYKFSYREKSFSNLHPKVKLKVNYKIHPAIARGLNTGRTYK